jgi:predicted O-methyltransferase YrrM
MAVGYSAIVMANSLEKKVLIDTIEINEYGEKARYFEKYGYYEHRVICGMLKRF